MSERHPAWVSGINDFEARLATGAGYTSAQANDVLDPLRVRSGIRDTARDPGRVTVGTNTVTVNPFQAVIQDSARPALGAYVVTLDAAKDLSLAGADQALDRIDLVIAEIDTTADPGFVVRIAQGTSSAGAVDPTITNPLHIKLARIRIPRGGAPRLDTDLRQFTASIGGILPVRTTADLPLEAPASQFVYRLDTRVLQVRMDGVWTAYRPPRGSVDTWHAPTFGAGWGNYTGSGGYAPAGYTITEDGWVRLRGLVQTTIARTAASNAFRLPSGLFPRYRHLFNQMSANGPWRVDVLTSGDVAVQASSSAALQANDWLSLEGIAFSASAYTLP